jgi:predicted ribosome quality control (RQC) complex YloA/Tae2 family protein
MYFDSLTITAIAAELRAELLDGRVQEVLLPDPASVALEIYAGHRRRYLVASTDSQTARVHLLDEKPRRGVETVSPLLLLLRKYVRSARLVGVIQPPAERVLHLAFDGLEGPVTLVAEIMGRYSNLVLVGADGAVLDALKRVGPEINRYRTVLPGGLYVPPPPQDKLLPAEVSEYRLRQVLAQAPPSMPLRQALVNGLAGISPLAAREIAFRAAGDAEAPVEAVQALAPLLDAYQTLTASAPQPCVVREDDSEAILAFAAYPLTHMGDFEPVQSISAVVAAYFGGEGGGYQAAKAPLLSAIQAARERLAHRQARLAEERAAAGDPEALRAMGEAILACAHQIKPGQAELVVEWTAGQPGQSPTRVALDPTLSPSENAQAYFRRYRKAQRAGEEVPAQSALVEGELQYLEQLAHDLAMAENRPEIDAVAVALAEGGYLKRKRRPSPPPAGPRRFTSPDGFTVWVGRNAAQNEELTFKHAAPDDVWLHARGVPGAHLIVQSEGRPVPESTIEWAAGLAANYSQGRDDAQVEVVVTRRRHVHRLKGGRPGQVTVRHERTMSVRPEMPNDKYQT